MKEEDKQYLSQVGMCLADLFYSQKNIKMKQTAVEWLVSKFRPINWSDEMFLEHYSDIIEQAKQIEKAEKDKQYQRGFKDGSKHIKIIYNL